MSIVPKTRIPFRSDFLESALVRYYLRTDGPFGSAPLKYIDTSAQRLASALGLRDSNDVSERVLASFAERSSVVDALRWGSPTIERQEEGPGFFRWLVLSCLIASVSTELADEGNYRDRLRLLLGFRLPISDLSGISRLWKRLARWSETARAKGLPFRKVALPDPGSMTQIGFSLKIAFPSRRDRDRYETIAADLSGLVDDPAQVIHFFHRQIDRYPWSDGFKAAFFEFEKRFRAGDRLLLDHAFWCFIKETAHKAESGRSNGASCLRLLPDFDREPQAEAISESKIEADERWEHLDRVGYVLSGSLDHVLQALIANSRRLDGILHKAARETTKGLLIFKEDGWGSWSWSQHPDSGYVRVLVHDRLRERCSRYFRLRKASTFWWMSEQMGLGQYEGICTALGLAPPRSGVLKRLAAEGGIKTAGMYLGRRSLLPIVRAHAGVEVAVDPQRAELGALEVDQVQHDRIQFSSTARLSGRWRISASESDRDAPTELNLTFIDQAVVHPSLSAPNPAAWRRDAEASGSREVEIRQAPPIARPAGHISDSMNDLLEAVYAGGRSGWSEMDLIPLLASISGAHGPRPWDLLRALRDSGWLEPWIARGWKARRWYLAPIKLFQVGRTVILSGAAGEVSRERFSRTTEELGGQVDIDASAGYWAVPLIKASRVDAMELSKAVGLKLHRPIVLDMQKAPLCWSKQQDNFERRELARRWDWKNERFSYTSDCGASPVKLETWIRPTRDSPDLYRVLRRDGSEALFANRTCAVLETYRSAKRSLFRKKGHWLFAKTSDGKLPDAAVDRLRLRHLIAPGIVGDGSDSSYAYPVDQSDMAWLGERLGAELFEHENTPRSHPAFHFRNARGEKFLRAAINAEKLRFEQGRS